MLHTKLNFLFCLLSLQSTNNSIPYILVPYTLKGWWLDNIVLLPKERLRFNFNLKEIAFKHMPLLIKTKQKNSPT